jgi:hypothetical protein
LGSLWKRQVAGIQYNDKNSALILEGIDMNLVPHHHPMSMPGDSGSLILNSEGDLIALLRGGGSSPENVSYVTPIEEVIADIERQTDHIVKIPGGIDPYCYDNGGENLPMAYQR